MARSECLVGLTSCSHQCESRPALVTPSHVPAATLVLRNTNLYLPIMPGEHTGIIFKCLHCIVRHRWIVGLLCMAILIGSVIAALVMCDIPDMTDPSEDFVTINTDWSSKSQQFDALMAATSSVPTHSGAGLSDVNSYAHRAPTINGRLLTARRHRSRRQSDLNTIIGIGKRSVKQPMKLCYGDSYSTDPMSINLWKTYAAHGRLVVSMDNPVDLGAINNSTTWDNLFTLPAAFVSLCRLQKRISRLEVYRTECVYQRHDEFNLTYSEKTECCPIWSVANLVTAMLGASSCEEVSNSQVTAVGDLLLSCVPAFLNGTLKRSCWDQFGSDPTMLCPFIQPVECLSSSLIPLILATSLPLDVSSLSSLPIGMQWRTSLIQLPLRRANSLFVYLELEATYASGNLTRDLPVPLYVHGMYLHAYNQLVSTLIRRDTFWLGMGLIALLASLGLGTTSLSLPLLTMTAISWSLLTAYLIYTRLLAINHFPLINCMAIVLAVGLGADDLLVYVQIWDKSRGAPLQRTISSPISNPPTSTVSSEPSVTKPHRLTFTLEEEHLVERLYFTFTHAVPSMLLTSLSTLLGLLVNLMSSIVAVQRFAIFAGLVVMCNMTFVLLSAPMLFLLLEPLRQRWCNLQILSRLSNCCPTPSLSNMIISTRFAAPITFLLAIAIAGYELLIEQRFTSNHQHDSTTTQSTLFRSTHPFEQFLHKQASWFWTERQLHYHSHLLYAHFVWGFKPWDNRTMWTYSSPTTSATPWLADWRVNLTASDSRNWLSHFCSPTLLQLPYRSPSDRGHMRANALPAFTTTQLHPYLTNPLWCPLGRFPHSLDNYIFAYACQQSTPSACCPVGQLLDVYRSSPEQFRRCLGDYVSSDSHVFPREYQSGYRFRLDSDEPVGLVITVLTNISLATTTHDELSRVVHDLSNWFQQALQTAPTSLAGGQMVLPNLGPFEVADNVTHYVHWSVLSAILLATLLVFCSSRNIWLALLACLSLVTCLMVTVSVLTWLDRWRLGIVEGLIISLSAGLAVDPCLHLALSVSMIGQTTRHTYRSCCGSWTLESVREALGLLNEAVSGSAWSTGIAGLAMIPCGLLCYHQIGVFLAVLMLCSWLFCYTLFAGNLACVADLMAAFHHPRRLSRRGHVAPPSTHLYHVPSRLVNSR